MLFCKVDLIVCILTYAAFVTRLWSLSSPSSIVFDEVQIGKFVSFYINGTFFFDTQPPLGKMLIAFVAYLGGYDGMFSFDNIGDEFPASVPVWYLRIVSAVSGSLLVPISYFILHLFQYNKWICTVAALLVLLDNAILTQSRLMVVDSILLLFISLATLCLIGWKTTDRRNLRLSCVWMFLLGISLSVAVCVKYAAVFMFVLILYHLYERFWEVLLDGKISHIQCIKFITGAVVLLFIVPLLLYVLVFYIHLSLLYKSGPHDSLMTSAFQASLQGGLSDMTRDQPDVVVYGSQVTLRHTHSTMGSPCWLHSHEHVYPLRYEDGRGSSHQQQVSCYSFKDVNNWWIVKHPNEDIVGYNKHMQPVHDGDIIELLHGMTGRPLNSHDVAAPVSPQYQEVSCYIDYNVNMDAQSLWKVKILNEESADRDVWRSIKSVVQLIHVNTSKALKTSGLQLSDWGFNQFEVVCDPTHNQQAALWNVEEHQYAFGEHNETKLRSDDNIQALGFWRKFYELQWKMLTSQLGQTVEHFYSSDPLQWPLLEQNIIYSIDTKTNAQIHFIGNPMVWFPCSTGVLVFTLLLTFYLLRRRRCCFDITSDLWKQFWDTTTLLSGGYFVNFLPYLLMDRTLFMYQYLPALYFSILVLAAIIGHLHTLLASRYQYCGLLLVLSMVLWMMGVLRSFISLSILSYGSAPVDSLSIVKLKWLDTWDFHLPNNS